MKEIFRSGLENIMEFTFTAMTAPFAQEIVSWQYPGIYAFYNMGRDPEDLAEFLDTNNWGTIYYDNVTLAK